MRVAGCLMAAATFPYKSPTPSTSPTWLNNTHITPERNSHTELLPLQTVFHAATPSSTPHIREERGCGWVGGRYEHTTLRYGVANSIISFSPRYAQQSVYLCSRLVLLFPGGGAGGGGCVGWLNNSLETLRYFTQKTQN